MQKSKPTKERGRRLARSPQEGTIALKKISSSEAPEEPEGWEKNSQQGKRKPLLEGARVQRRLFQERKKERFR